jgi:stage V sporulation protein SpoVS
MKVLWASATTDSTAVRGAVASGVRETGAAKARVSGRRVMARAVRDVAQDGWVRVTCGADAFWVPGFASA